MRGWPKGLESLAPGLKLGINALPPNGTITGRDTITKHPNSDVGVQVVAVIFADSSAVGDSQVIQDLFRQRQAQTGILDRWLQEVSKLDRSDSRRFFIDLAGAMTSTEDPDSDWVHQAAENQNKPERAAQVPMTPDAFVQMLRARYAAAKANSTRRVQ
jgi:hypothetical protein